MWSESRDGSIIVQALPGLIVREGLDLVVANGENAAGGLGHHAGDLSRVDPRRRGLHHAGRSHLSTARNRAAVGQETNIVKPANFPPEAAGHEFAVVEARNGVEVAVVQPAGARVHASGRLPVCRGRSRAGAICRRTVKVIVLDCHAEATSDKQLMGRYLDGRVSAVLGTHTHVPTADEQILPGGTAFQCDVGMTGPVRKHPGAAHRPRAGNDANVFAYAF